jgi:hypothetical protein
VFVLVALLTVEAVAVAVALELVARDRINRPARGA